MHAHTRGWLLALALAAPLALVAGSSSADPLVLDRVVAVVDDEIVLESDLDLWLIFDDNIRLELSKIENPTEQQIIAKLTELRPSALDELIGRMLLLRQAATFQIKATDAELDNYLASLARQAQLAGIPELKRAVEESGQYGNWEQYTGKLREDIVLYKLEGMMLNVAVSDAQVLERYRQLSKGEEGEVEVHRLSFRPATDEASASDEAFKQAKAAVRRLSDGEDPAALAEELGQSGEVETLTRDDVARPIGERLFTAKAGQVIGPLESGQGFVVFKIEKVVSSDLLGFEEAKDELKNQLFEEAYEKARIELRDQLRSRAHVEIRL
ncbi:peptidylprolyl isomerase [Nannocystaceae bacterium ST9]